MDTKQLHYLIKKVEALQEQKAALLEVLRNITEAVERRAPELMPWANTARAVMAALKERP